MGAFFSETHISVITNELKGLEWWHQHSIIQWYSKVCGHTGPITPSAPNSLLYQPWELHSPLHKQQNTVRQPLTQSKIAVWQIN